MKDGFIERRKYARLECSMPVQYKKVGDLDSGISKALTRDISEGGVRLVVDEYIPTASKLTLIISFPFRDKKIKALGKIVWARRHSEMPIYDVGIEFISTTKSTKRDIADFVRSKLS